VTNSAKFSWLAGAVAANETALDADAIGHFTAFPRLLAPFADTAVSGHFA
jgi:hypothetical protein